jgi:hypothetical protein
MSFRIAGHASLAARIERGNTRWTHGTTRRAVQRADLSPLGRQRSDSSPLPSWETARAMMWFDAHHSTRRRRNASVRGVQYWTALYGAATWRVAATHITYASGPRNRPRRSRASGLFDCASVFQAPQAERAQGGAANLTDAPVAEVRRHGPIVDLGPGKRTDAVLPLSIAAYVASTSPGKIPPPHGLGHRPLEIGAKVDHEPVTPRCTATSWSDGRTAAVRRRT